MMAPTATCTARGADSNEAYQKYVRSQQERTGEEGQWCVNGQCQDQAPRSALVRCWGDWRASHACRETYMTLTYAEHSRLAFAVNNVILFAIIWSIVMFCLETVPRIERGPAMDWIRSAGAARNKGSRRRGAVGTPEGC